MMQGSSSDGRRGTKRSRGEEPEFGDLPDSLAGVRRKKTKTVATTSNRAEQGAAGRAAGDNAELERLTADNQQLRTSNQQLEERLAGAGRQLEEANQRHNTQIEEMRGRLDEANATHTAQIVELRREMNQLQRGQGGRAEGSSLGRNNTSGVGSSSAAAGGQRVYPRPADGQYSKYNADGTPLERKYWSTEATPLDKTTVQSSGLDVKTEYKTGGIRWDFVEKQNILLPGADRRPYVQVLPDGEHVSRSPSPVSEAVTYPDRVWYVIPPHCKAEAERFGARPINKQDIDEFKNGRAEVKAKYKNQRILHYVEGVEHNGQPLDRNRFKSYSQFNVRTGEELEAGVHPTAPDRVARHARREVSAR